VYNNGTLLWTGLVGDELTRLSRSGGLLYALGMEIERNARVYVAGHRGLVGSAIWRRLQQLGFTHLLGRTRAELDLLDGAAVRDFYKRERPEYVILAAAKVGGILANSSQPVGFLYENLVIQNNVIHGAYEQGVRKLLFLGSSCIYPRLAPQPLKEEYLLTGPLEPTNEWYAIAKIAGIKLCAALRRQYGADFISTMPTNMYGPNDNYDLQSSHVLPALIRKFHDARLSSAASVTCWGTGSPLREFLYADDLAVACLFLLENYSEEQFLNIGSGMEISIRQLAELVRSVVGYKGEIVWDASKPDGPPRKLMDSSRLFALGWRPKVSLESGIQLAYQDFLQKFAQTPAAAVS
jgi:GDP-L-fucose synthase